ncbi:MAG TPA: DUF1850 domain-containing protein [Ottowia sp.]|uniref:DUF1850 domain-containing protein n=1 Tax=Ottowia sp. TaxID=1898956 RepID=UPI002BAB3800|nr:DUF1850 domain-containing protein [Ottowia sp.]HMN21693.1 DUF1850 domain-containing protein [Ottowia sp.]
MAGAALLGACLALAASLPPDATIELPAAGDAGVRFVAASRFTLAWTHSIEKTRWEEDYRVRRDAAGRPGLQLERARIRGSGAGMEPPADAVLRDGWYEYRPAERHAGVLRLTRSIYTADYDWCVAEVCVPLGHLLPSDGGVTLLWPCETAS